MWLCVWWITAPMDKISEWTSDIFIFIWGGYD